MKRRFTIKSLFSVLSIFLLLWLASPAAGEAHGEGDQWKQGEPPLEMIRIPPESLAQISSPPSYRGLQARNPKLDSSLAELLQTENTADRDQILSQQGLRFSDERIQVQITLDADTLESALQAIAELDGLVTKAAPEGDLLQAWLPIDSLESLTERGEIYRIQRPDQMILLEADVGAMTTEALGAMNAGAWHDAGFRGQGVKIGVVDGGFTGYLNLLGTDLPSNLTAKNFVDGQGDGQINTGTEHGTACAEVIHDVAPEAELYLAKIATYLDLVEAVTWLRDTVGVDIISTSMGFYNLTPGDGAGVLENLVRSARDAGILWVTAAGNDQRVHWGGAYLNKDSDSYHEYYDGKDVNYFGPGNGNAYQIPAGRWIQIFLRWDDWSEVKQDYDLLLFHYTGAKWQLITVSENVQNGGPGQRPTEAIVIQAPYTGAYGFKINRYKATRSVNLEVFAPQMTSLAYRNPNRSLANLADAASAMTAAALHVESPYNLEPYSSQGPTNGPGGTAIDGLIKPDISAFANISTVAYGPINKFNGTSAATPHVAGAAALVLQAFPASGPDNLQAYLESMAADMGDAGKDNIYGSGRIRLGAPPVWLEEAFHQYIPILVK